MRSHTIILTLATALSYATPATTDERARVEHPYLLWTSKDLRATRRTIETQPWAKQSYQQMVASTDRDGEDLRLLFRYAVMGDREAGEIEKKPRLTSGHASSAGCGVTSSTQSSPVGRTTHRSTATRRTTPATMANRGAIRGPTGYRTSFSHGNSVRTWPPRPWATSN